MERFFISVLVCGLALGLGASLMAPDVYVNMLAAEDGPFEWATAVFLFCAALICAMRIRLADKGTMFRVISAFGFLVLLFGAGEEISWGQRVFGWASGEFWVANNAQAETNLHNLMVGEVKINKLIFGVALTTAFILYFAALPWLYGRMLRLRAWADSWGVPVPKWQHGAVFVASLIVMSLVPTSRSAELGEFAIGVLLALVVLRPANRSAFR